MVETVDGAAEAGEEEVSAAIVTLVRTASLWVEHDAFSVDDSILHICSISVVRVVL